MDANIILINVLSLLILAAVFIPWRRLATRWLSNNPDRGYVFQFKGGQVRYPPYKATRSYEAGDGEVFMYDHNRQVVVLPKDYPVAWYNGGRLIHQPLGSACASYFNLESPSSVGAKDVADVVIGKLVSQAVQGLKGQAMAWLAWALIIGGVLILGYIGYTQFLAPKSPVTQAQISSPVPDYQVPGTGSK